MNRPNRSVVFALAMLGCVAACSSRPATVAAQPTQAPAGKAPESSGAGTATGTVAETMNAGGYTYFRLQASGRDLWVAATQIPVKVGERLTVPLEMPMEGFRSNALNRDFPLIYFVSQIAREGEPLLPFVEPPNAAAGSRGANATSPQALERISAPEGGMAIADIWKQRASLADKVVVARGRVVKVNLGIMGRNWIHLQDGSGSAADGTHDLIVTTAAVVAVGDTVTMSGVLAIGRDLGSGYRYEVILEQATVRGR